jgi:hypothetical protein
MGVICLQLFDALLFLNTFKSNIKFYSCRMINTKTILFKD